jgi:Ankyrin repeats (3 copies)/Ankyrin repeats (many copies)
VKIKNWLRRRNASFTMEELVAVIRNGRLEEWAQDKRITRQDFLKTVGEWTPLHLAALYGHLDQAAALLEKNEERFNKEDFLKPANDGWTLLHRAAVGGHLDQASTILEKNREHFTKADFLKQNANGQTLLSWAAAEGHLDQAAALLAKNAERFGKDDFLKPDNNGWTPLYWAAEKGHLDQIFIAENWMGRVGEMEELWQSVPGDKRDQIDYPAIRQRALELTIQRVRPVQRLEHGTGSNVAPPNNGFDRSKEGKS